MTIDTFILGIVAVHFVVIVVVVNPNVFIQAK